MTTVSDASRPRVPDAYSSALWLVRHAQPLVARGVCYGTTDMPADEAATKHAAMALAQQLPIGARLFSSPLQRCRQLTQALLVLRADLQASIEPRLVEMDFGCWEGQRWDAIPRSAIDAWTADFGGLCFGGGESVQTLLNRVAGIWDASRKSNKQTVWITHAGVMRAAMLLQQNVRTVQRGDQWPRQTLEFGTCHRLAWPADTVPD
jgi:alpha-ribazole phosphatase